MIVNKFDTIGLISTNLAEKIDENACISSFKNTAKNISTLTGQRISHTGAWNVTQQLGEKVADGLECRWMGTCEHNIDLELQGE